MWEKIKNLLLKNNEKQSDNISDRVKSRDKKETVIKQLERSVKYRDNATYRRE